MLQNDNWLSQYLGNAFRYLPPFEQKEWPRGFVYAKLDSSDISSFNGLVKQGFQLVEVSLVFFQQYICEKIKEKNDFVVREAKVDDQQRVIEIAGNSFTNSRFHQDPNIGLETANKIKSDWVRNYFNGTRGDQMFIAENSGQVIGFLQLINNAIDLIAVDNKFQGQGVGSAMISKANEKIGVLQAGTQSTNISAIKLYQNNGLQFSSAQLVVHKWEL